MPIVTAQATLPTTAPVAPTEAPKQTDTNVSQEVQTTQEAPDPRLVALARQQKALRAQQRAKEQALASKEAAISAKEAEYQTHRQKAEQFDAWKQRLTQDPYSVMLESGLTADQVATLMLNQPNPADQRVLLLEQEIKALKAAQDQSSKKFDEVQTQQYEEAKKQIKNDVVLAVDGDSSFEAIKAMNAQDAVVELIAETFNTEGRLMTIDEAANEIENYLVEEASKIAQISKIRSKFTQPVQQVQKQIQPQKQSTTLSNRMVQLAAPTSAKERRERAIAAFMGKL